MGKWLNNGAEKDGKGDRTEDFVLRPQEDRGTQTKEAHRKARTERKDHAKRIKKIERTRVRVARLSVASNTTLLVLKLVFGILMGSISVISEGIHSGMDLLAALLALMAVGRSLRPADADHSYGHGKYEPISGTIEAILIFIAAVLIIYEAILKILNHTPVEMLEGGIIIMLISVILNIIVSRMLMKVAIETGSLALEADALHLTTDVLTSAGVMIGLIVIRLTGFFFLDPIVAIGVAMLIIKAAWDLTRKTIADLSDKRIPEEEEKVIRDLLDGHDHVIHDYHDLRTRMSGHNRYIDLHIVVSRDLGLVETHRLCDHLEAEIKSGLPHSHALIHCEPCNGKCDHCDEHAVCEELRNENLERIKRRKAETALKNGEAIEVAHDEGPDEVLTELERHQLEERIRKILKRYDEVVSYHRIDPRHRGDKLLLTLHVLVNAKMTVERGHEIDHALETGLRGLYPNLEVIAHMEPCNGECEGCKMDDCPERMDERLPATPS
jgi:cation diffusion facilitator family transporter